MELDDSIHGDDLLKKMGDVRDWKTAAGAPLTSVEASSVGVIFRFQMPFPQIQNGVHAFGSEPFTEITFKSVDRFGLDLQKLRAEPERIRVYREVTNWSPKCDGSSEDEPLPELLLEIVNEERVNRNNTLRAAQEAEQERRGQEARALEATERKDFQEMVRQEHLLPLLATVKGKQIYDLRFEDGRLTIVLQDAPPLEINVRSVGVRMGGGSGIMDCPELVLKVDKHELGGYQTIYQRPSEKKGR